MASKQRFVLVNLWGKDLTLHQLIRIGPHLSLGLDNTQLFIPLSFCLSSKEGARTEVNTFSSISSNWITEYSKSLNRNYAKPPP